MKVSCFARFALLSLAAFIFQTVRFMAFAANLTPGARLCDLDSKADRAFQIASLQSLCAPKLLMASST
jgi:hypothetical protein